MPEETHNWLPNPAPAETFWESLESLSWLFSSCTSSRHSPASPVCSVLQSAAQSLTTFILPWWIEPGLILLLLCSRFLLRATRRTSDLQPGNNMWRKQRKLGQSEQHRPIVVLFAPLSPGQSSRSLLEQLPWKLRFLCFSDSVQRRCERHRNTQRQRGTF